MKRGETETEGTKAALGKRRPTQTAVRDRLKRAIQFVEYRMLGRSIRKATHLRFVPEPENPAELARLTARVNLYLPAAFRKLPLYAGEYASSATVSSSDAPEMAEDLFGDPEWLAQPPDGHGHTVVTRASLAGGAAWVRSVGRASLVDPKVAYGLDEMWFALTRQTCEIPQIPTPSESQRRLASLRVPSSTAIVLATGPSAKLVDSFAARNRAAIRITCNSAIRDRELLAQLQPQVIAFGDPYFHFGPSRYAAAFRRDLKRAIDDTEAIFLTTSAFSSPLVAHLPEIANRLAVLPMTTEGTWRWPTESDPTTHQSGNVLTNLMLPAAFLLSDHVEIAGCDGRNPTENYYWRHNSSTQYSDDLMKTVFEAHIGFFKFRSYEDYYEKHCAQLEEFFQVAERAGKTVSGITPSHIPALRSRGSTPPD